jgi:hypothetical protein
MGGCLIALVALITPRVVLAAIWLLTDWFNRAYETAVWPLLGWIFMPYTTAAYMAAMLNNNHHVSGLWLVLVVLAVLVDIGAIGGGGRASARVRYQRRRN